MFGRPLEFRIADSLHVGSGTFAERTGRQTGVAQILRDHENAPLVPGSTWKGVLRARVEFILRSVGIGPVCASTQDDASGSCNGCVVCDSFGWTPRTGAAAADGELPKAAGARGRLLFADSPSATAASRSATTSRSTGSSAAPATKPSGRRKPSRTAT